MTVNFHKQQPSSSTIPFQQMQQDTKADRPANAARHVTLLHRLCSPIQAQPLRGSSAHLSKVLSSSRSSTRTVCMSNSLPPLAVSATASGLPAHFQSMHHWPEPVVMMKVQTCRQENPWNQNTSKIWLVGCAIQEGGCWGTATGGGAESGHSALPAAARGAAEGGPKRCWLPLHAGQLLQGVYLQCRWHVNQGSPSVMLL